MEFLNGCLNVRFPCLFLRSFFKDLNFNDFSKCNELFNDFCEDRFCKIHVKLRWKCTFQWISEPRISMQTSMNCFFDLFLESVFQYFRCVCVCVFQNVVSIVLSFVSTIWISMIFLNFYEFFNEFSNFNDFDWISMDFSNFNEFFNEFQWFFEFQWIFKEKSIGFQYFRCDFWNSFN